MASQNINQYVYPNLFPKFVLDITDMSLTSDETGFNQEVVFSPYLIAQTYGNKLPIYLDINDPNTVPPYTLTYGQYNFDNVFVSQNYYNGNSEDLNCKLSGASCDIGLTGIDNGLVTGMTGQTIYFTDGIFDNSLKFERLYFDRRFKMFQVTGYTSSPNIRFSGFNKTVLYEVVSKTDPYIGLYHELYGGFYQGFYKLHGYDYDILPQRMNKGWSVEMILKPRLVNEYAPGSGQTTLNQIYPNNKNIFFYLGTRAENKFYHHADGHPNCFTGYTRVTSGLTCIETCACCNRIITNSRCIYVYPPRSVNGIHDSHVNYGCDKCGGIPQIKVNCGCNCNLDPCLTCGWECQTHTCENIIELTPTPTPTPTSTPTFCDTPAPCETCTTCDTCDTCNDCTTSGFTSIENTCEVDPKWDVLSNNIAFRLCGESNNPQIGVKVLRFTGDCQTTGTCDNSGFTYTTGYTIVEYCTPPIYPYCLSVNPAYLGEEHWFQVDFVWERYTWLDDCDLWYRGGLGEITEKHYLESLANNTVSLIAPPYTRGTDGLEIELINLNEKWLIEKEYRTGRLKIYINGRIFYTIEDFEEVIPRALNTDKERQVGVPFNISWGGGSQGLRENLTFTNCSGEGPYQQDPESLPTIDFSGTSLSGLTTNILIEQNFGGTFEGGISQFRFYVEPLSAPEVKHNFELRVTQFQMFNPDCPDCSISACTPVDIQYIIEDVTPTPTVTPTRTPTLTPTPTTTITITPSVTPTISITPSITPTISNTPTNTTTPTQTITPSQTDVCPLPTPSVTPTIPSTPTPTTTNRPTSTPTQTVTQTPSITPTITTSVTPTKTVVPSSTPTTTQTITPTVTPSLSVSVTPTNTPDPTTTPSTTITSTPSVTPSITVTSTPTNTPDPTTTPTKTPTSTITSTPTVTPTKTTTPTNTTTPTVTPTNTKTPTVTPTTTVTTTPTSTPTKSVVPSATPTKTPTKTPTVTPSITLTKTPTNTPDPSDTPTPTPSVTPSITPTKTTTLTPTNTPEPTRSLTPTKSITPSVTPTNTPTITPSNSPDPTSTPTVTPNATPSVTPTNTPTVTPTNTNDPTSTPTKTPTPTPSITPTITPTISLTPSITPTSTTTPTTTPSVTPTKTNTPTPSITKTSTPTTSVTPSITPTNTITPTTTTTPTPSSTEPCCSIIYLYGGNIVSQSTTFSVVDCSNNTSSITVGYNETYILNCHKTATVTSGPGSSKKNELCICTTATPTPTVTPTITPSVTSTVTPSVTPTITTTPTRTVTPTSTK